MLHLFQAILLPVVSFNLSLYPHPLPIVPSGTHHHSSVPATAGTTTVRQFFQRFTQTQALQQPQAGTVAYCSAECAAQGLAERGRQLVLPDSRRSSKASASAAAFSAGSNPEAKAPPSKRAKPSPQPQQQQVQPQPHQDDLKMCSQCHVSLMHRECEGSCWRSSLGVGSCALRRLSHPPSFRSLCNPHPVPQRGLKTEMFSGTQLKKKGKRKCNDCVEP